MYSLSDWIDCPFCFGYVLCSTHNIVLQLENSTRSTSAINPVNTEITAALKPPFFFPNQHLVHST